MMSREKIVEGMVRDRMARDRPSPYGEGKRRPVFQVRKDLHVYRRSVCKEAFRVFSLFRSVRTCMSIAAAGNKRTRSARTLIVIV